MLYTELAHGAAYKFCKSMLKPTLVSPIQAQERLAPIVHVLKADGTTRSCGGCVVTVNPQSRVLQYSILFPEEFFL